MTARAGRAWLVAASALLLFACAPALRTPPPVAALGDPPGSVAPNASLSDVSRLIADGEAAFSRRPDMREVTTAYSTFLAAARADDSRVDGLLGAAAAAAWIIEHEADETRRSRLATEAVQVSQWCTARAPAEIACRYRLALAIGQQARERPGTSRDGLTKMIALLGEVIAASPRLDHAGAHRVMALTLLRAPGWPAGPGDAEAALEHARKADELVPDNAGNLSVFAEALAKNGAPQEARQAYTRAREIAAARAAAGDPDAAEIVESVVRALMSLPR